MNDILKPAFAAVYCVYDETTWLSESVESVYETVDAIYFLVSDKPWYGKPSGNRSTIERIGKFADPHKKMRVIEGAWTNETDQRNAGLDILQKEGFTYCFVIDADEVYDPVELKRMMEYVTGHPEVDCWHMKWDTYWKTYTCRIDPREPFEPLVFVKTGKVLFTKNRTIAGGRHGLVPPGIGICHHLSYARSDEEVLRKITTFSHAHEVQPGWIENVWKKWDTDHSLPDLHPTHPHAYQRAVEQPYSVLPPVLKKRYAADEKTRVRVTPGLASIIILAHNRWDQTELCLRSIEQHTPEPHEIIVVDNGSTDGTKERLKALVETQGSRVQGFKDSRICTGVSQYAPTFEPSTPRPLESSPPVFRVISNEANRGFAAGCNQGLAAACGEYVLLLNNDTIVTPGWLGSMVEVFQRYPKTGIVGPVSNNVTRPQLVENVDHIKDKGIDEFARQWAKAHEGRNFTTTKASGFCLLAKREVIDTIGGLDEQFGSGNFEDDDFCSRALLAGFEIRIAQDVFIYHEGRQTFKSAGIDYNAKMSHNWKLYKAKWGIPEDAPLDRYWVPSRPAHTVDLYAPLPRVSADDSEGDAAAQELNAAQINKKTKIKERAQMGEKEEGNGFTSIIVLVSDKREYPKRCVESIFANTEGPYEIIVLPRDPSYAPPKWLRRLMKEHPNCRVVTPPSPSKNKGPRVQGFKDSRGDLSTHADPRSLAPWNPVVEHSDPRTLDPSNPASLPFTYAQACNLGIRESSGEYLAVLSDAVVVTREWLSGMLECLNSSEDAGIVGPVTANVEGPQGIEMDIQGSWIRGAKGSSETEAEKGFRPSRNDKDSNPRILDPSNPEMIDAFAKAFRERNRYRRVQTRHLDSSCLLLRRGLTEKIGLFDEGFNTDRSAVDDYCLRAALEGDQSVIAADVFIDYAGRGRTKEEESPAAIAADKRAFSRKWGNLDDPDLMSKGISSLNSLLLADELTQQGQKEKAAVALIEGIKKDPADKRLHYALAQVFMEDKKFPDALSLLEKIPGGAAQDKDRRKLELIGYCKEAMGLDEEAGQYADKILAWDDTSASAWNLKGAIAFKKGLTSDAEKYFTRALECDRGFGEAYSNLGALQWIAGNKEKAFGLFEKGFILSPTLADVVTNYYTAAVSLSRLPDAARTFGEAIALHPFNRRLKFILIDNLLQQGKFPEAMNALEEAMVAFGIDDDTLSLAINLRDRVGPMEIGERQKSSGEVVKWSKEKGLRGQGFSEKDSRGQGVKGSSDSTPSNARILESLNPSVSLCMIVKNEEKNIVRSLMSVKALVDEMIVVDTGSSDRTKKIAAAFGAKVYDFKWTDSFSDARNFSLSKATGKWILVLDADEVISPSDYGKLRELAKPLRSFDKLRMTNNKLSAPDVMVSLSNHAPASGGITYSFITRNYVGPVSVNWNPNDGQYGEEAGSGWFPSGKVRLFPNDSAIRFEKPVHETVEDSLLRAGYVIKKSDIPIHHYGKLDKEVIRAKGEEYYELGKKKLAERGVQEPHALYELAVQASELEKYDEALEFWKRLIAVKPDLAKAYYGMGTCCYQLGRYEEARAAYKKAIDFDPGSKDAVVMHATSELLSGNAGSAISQIEAFLRKDPAYPLALLAATAAYFCAGRKDRGLEYAGKVEQTQFGLAPYLSDIAKLMISAKHFDYAIALLEAAVETNNVTNETQQLLNECYGMKDSRGQGFEDSSEHPKKKRLTPRPLESSNPGTLSLCMIVKNEEDSIERALTSVKPVVDELIVVDTGSIDRTKDIARSLGAQVYDFTWTDSFSDARNFSISKATGKWILVLDADETISPLDYEKLRALITPPIPPFGKGGDGGVIAYSFVTRTYVTQLNTAGWVGNEGEYPDEEVGSGWFPGEKVRLFPNDVRFRFEYPLHERIEPSLIKAGAEIRECDIPVHHYGNFVTKEKAASKAGQYYQLGKKKLAEYGEQNFMAFYELALLGAEAGRHEEALEHLKKVISLRPDFPKAHQSAGNAYYNLERYEEALSSYKKALQLDPASQDALLMRATCEILTGNAEGSVYLLEAFLANNPSHPRALLLLAEAHFCVGNRDKGVRFAQKLRDIHFNMEDTLTQFARLLVSAGRRDYAISLLQTAGLQTGSISSGQTTPTPP